MLLWLVHKLCDFFKSFVFCKSLIYQNQMAIHFQDVHLFCFNRLISVSICLRLTSLKLKTPFLLHLVLIARMLHCFLYLRIAFKVGSLTFSIIGSKSEYWEMLRFFAILPKKLLKSQLFLFQFSQFHHFHSNLFFLWH